MQLTYFNELEFKRLWNDGLIALDTSVLLFLQECEAEYSKYIMDTLLFVEDRIWIPHHVAHVEMKTNFEYEKPISGAIGRLRRFNKTLAQSVSKINDSFQTLSRELKDEGHYLLSDILLNVNTNDMFYDLFSNFKESMDVSTKENKEFLQSGLVQVFQKSLCSNFSPLLKTVDVLQIESEGIERYHNKIPPGYCDAAKVSNKFGDLIVWKELLKKSHDDQQPILFITREKKEDWFELDEKKTIIRVREELIQESKKNRSAIFILHLNDFIRMSSQLVSKNVDELMNMLESSDDLYSEIEEYINDHIYDVISKELDEVGNFGYRGDYIKIDTIEDIQVEVISKTIADDIVDINCRVEFTANVVHSFYVGSKEDNIELNGLITCQVDASVTIDILSGHHDYATKTLLLSSTCIDFNDFEIIEATDPTEEPDQLDDGPDELYDEPEEPDELYDEPEEPDELYDEPEEPDELYDEPEELDELYDEPDEPDELYEPDDFF